MSLSDKRFDKYNIHKMIIKPLYLGVFLNIMIPGALLFVCFYLFKNNLYTDRIVGLESGDILFIVFAVLALINSGLALWMRQKLFAIPMVKNKDDFEKELTLSLLEKMRSVYILITAISVYGVGYYFLTARFEESAFFVVFSFLVFQVVRPRVGFTQKLIDAQLKLLENSQVEK